MRCLGIGSILALVIGVAPASAQSCGEAWYQRNLIYKQAGYCFTTPRAIRAFGNAGCSYDSQEDVPLSARQRATVAELRAFERSQGCPPIVSLTSAASALSCGVGGLDRRRDEGFRPWTISCSVPTATASRR